MTSIGMSVPRKESADKVTGALKYNDDIWIPGLLQGWVVTSTRAHAYIKSTIIDEAMKVQGVKAIITGQEDAILKGSVIDDRPVLAKDKVRHFGEPLAIVVANTVENAKKAANLICVEYENLPVVNTIADAMKADAVLVHENLGQYKHGVEGVYPEANTNIANRTCIYKGNIENAWNDCHVIVEESFSFPQTDHIAMETRSARVEIKPDGQVVVYTTTQAPYSVKKDISKYYNIEAGKVTVVTPLVGGGFGGKTSVQLELIAYIASRALGGKMVRIANTREMDMVTSPVHIGFEGTVKLGATKTCKIIAAEMVYLYDCGAYSDSGPKMSTAGAASCTGPYNIDNVHCESLCVYTNHSYATAFRGFGHIGFTTAIERTMDKLASKLKMDPLHLRFINAIMAGNTTPTRDKLNPGNVGDLTQCLKKVAKLINWEEGQRLDIGNNKIRAKGLSCLWKTSSSPSDAISGVILILNSDGSINLNCGVVEFGHSSKTTLAQILAQRMGMDVNQIHVNMEVNTSLSPEHWKTVASMTNYMAGEAGLEAAEDIIKKIKAIASISLRCSPSDLDIYGGRAYLKYDPDFYIEFKDLAGGIKFDNGNSMGGQIMGTGSFIMKHLTKLDQATGKGKTGPYWTVGAQAVEVEFDTVKNTYRLIKAATVLDAGKLLNPKSARGIVMGGMGMGLGLGFCEEFIHNQEGIVQNTSLRTYKPLRMGEEPQYLVEFVETPSIDGPYGARGIAEHPVIGMPGALLNSISCAAQIDFNKIPVTPEMIWKARVEE